MLPALLQSREWVKRFVVARFLIRLHRLKSLQHSNERQLGAGAILQFLRVIARATGQDGNSSSEGSHGNIHLIACTPTWAGGGTGRRRF